MANNPFIVLISGKSASGKSRSLKNLKNPEKVVYLCTENNKTLPFRSKFQEKNITSPKEYWEEFKAANASPDCETIITDSLTFLMDMYETQEVLTSDNTMKGWSNYAQFLKQVTQRLVAPSTKNIIFTAHTADQLNEAEMIMETMVKVKGSLMNNGVESFFNIVISTKSLPINKLEAYTVDNDLLEFTNRDKELGYKYVFQTRKTKETSGERMRGPEDLWGDNETFIDNDVQLVLDRLHEYYS